MMQQPFTITDDMQQELVNDLEKLSSQTIPTADDVVGQSPFAKRLRRRPVDLLHSESDAPGRSNDQKMSDEEAKHSEALEEDPINPSHYRKHPSGIECIEVTRHLNFNVGNAIKYIWRYQDKGDPVENLKKAQWYLDDEIRRLQGQR